MVMKQNRELEALQARIREAEERLKARQSSLHGGGNLGHDAGYRQDSKREYRSSGEDNTPPLCRDGCILTARHPPKAPRSRPHPNGPSTNVPGNPAEAMNQSDGTEHTPDCAGSSVGIR